MVGYACDQDGWVAIGVMHVDVCAVGQQPLDGIGTIAEHSEVER